VKTLFKKCRICKAELEESNFPFRNKQTGTRRTECKTCTAKIKSDKYFNNLEENKKKQKERRVKDREWKRGYDKKREVEKRDELRAKRKERYIRDRQKRISKRKEYYYKNKESCIKSVTAYQKNNKHKVRTQQRVHHNERMKSDPGYAILKSLRTMVSAAVKRGGKKCKRTMDLVGCSMDVLLRHLESKFLEGMSWSNYGSWHIDHKIPCAAFDMSIHEEQRKCFHYTNLQPLWGVDNQKKGAKIIYEQV
jgi:hypothetical protein